MRIMIEWPEIDQRVRATLYAEENPELCGEIWDALPMESIQNHASASGASMFAWVPILSHAKVNTFVNIKDAPVGCVRYLFTTGNKISIQYAKCTEDKIAPVIGAVDIADIPKLDAIGSAVFEAFMHTKDVIHVRYLKLDENDDPEPFDPKFKYVKPTEGATDAVKQLAIEIQKRAFINFAQEYEGLKRIRTGGNAGAGAGGQYFSSWDTAAGSIRDYSFLMYQITQLSRTGLFNAEQLCCIFNIQTKEYRTILKNNGCAEHELFMTKIVPLMENKATSVADFQTITDALCMYTNSLESWVFYEFPWGLGDQFRFTE